MANRKSLRRSAPTDKQPRGLDVWQRLTRLLVLFALLGVALLAFSYFVPELEKLKEMDMTNQRLTEVRDELRERKIDMLAEEQRSLGDPSYLEFIARDRLNMQLPDEVVIRIDRDGQP